MTRAQTLARTLGLRVRIRLSHKARALHLRFADASALWLSRSGAVLAAPASADSAAQRFALAHAQNVGWEILVDRPNWPVPRPCAAGDWLTVSAPLLSALRDQLLRAATIEPLVGSTLEPDHVLALLPQHELVPMPKFPPSGARRRIVLLSRTCIAQSSEDLALQIARLDTLAEEHSGLMIFWFKADTGALVTIPPEKLLTVLHDRLEKVPKELPVGAPTVVDEYETVDADGTDDDLDMRM